MTIVLAATTPAEQLSFTPNASYTVSYDATSTLAAYSADPNTGGNSVFWMTLSNSESSKGVVIGAGSASDTNYIYDNSGYQNNSTVTTADSVSLASTTFFLSKLPALQLDNGGNLISDAAYNPSVTPSYLTVWGINLTTYVVSKLLQLEISIKIQTPVYLGKATFTNTGDLSLDKTIATTNRFPKSQHELVPRAYVDSYIKSVTDYYDAILDPNSGLTGLLDRVSYLEAQLERAYQALWGKARDVDSINTVHAGAVRANYADAEAPNPPLISNHPAAPTTIDGFDA